MIKSNKLRSGNETHVVYCVLGRKNRGSKAIVKKFCEEYGFKVVKPNTTRNRRIGEYGDNSDFTFVHWSQFEKDKDKVIGYRDVGSSRYYVTEDQLLKGDFFLVDPSMLKEVQEKVNTRKIKIIPIVIRCSLRTAIQRASNRVDGIAKFSTKAEAENEMYYKFEKLIGDSEIEVETVQNEDTLEQAVNKMYSIVERISKEK